jgi:hypothetical protein
VKLFSFAMLFSAFFAWTWPLHAATVVLVRSPSPSSEVTETLSRIHGELLSVGLEVVLTDRPASREQADSRAWVAEVAAAGGARAVLDVIGDDTLVAVDVWTVKLPPGRFEVTRIAAESNTANPSERLALRTIEALRASLLEIDLAARQARGEPLSKPAAPTVVASALAPANERERFAFEIGVAGLMSLDGVGPAILPTVRAGWAARSWFIVQAALTGAGTSPTVTTTAGSASIAQQYGVLGACFRFGSDRRLWPFLGLAAGVLHTSVVGQPGLSMEGHDGDRWSLLFDASVGMGLRLYPRYYVTLAAHVQVADPYVAIHVADAVGATTGRPNLLLTLTVGAWL